ncbi:hypothetical protein [Streptosporangium sp. NPDC002721]|uniref:hypothetical protein n=1 Tax=Streptosporangium sp. NPDC002721 TaxID=3366188 RepID=UPI00367B46C1
MNRPAGTVVPGDAENTFIRAEFPVNYAQFYLHDGNPYRPETPAPGVPADSDAGILRTARGGAFLVTGLAVGNVNLTVSLHHHEPEPLLREYEDVVEASLRIDIPPLHVDSWGDHKSIELPPLPSETDWYRLRYHARDMDRARDLRSKEPIDSFHLQIWPAPHRDVDILQVVSEHARYRVSRLNRQEPG